MKKKSWIVGSVGVFSTALLVAAPTAQYRIRAKIDLNRNLISGTEKVVLNNTLNGALGSVYLFLYPNRFEAKDPGLNEMNYRWHYPSGRDKGWLRIAAVRNASGADLQGEVVDQPGLPAKTIYRVPLSRPLAPGASTALELDFECKIPSKYGPFGHFRDTVTAQGGWYPYLVPTNATGQPLFHALPQESSFEAKIQLSAPRDAVLNGRFFEQASEIELRSQQARYLSFVIAPRFYPERLQAGARTVTFYSLSPHRYKLDKVVASFANGVTGAATLAPASRQDEIAVVETYLRAVMTYPGEDMILVSDRFFVTVKMFDFRNLNRLEAARAVAQLLVADEVAGKESPVDYNWVAEAVAWTFRNDFLKKNFEALSNLRETAGRMGMFRPFNRMAASPTIPFSETYVGSVILRDPLRESLLYFNGSFPSGQVFAEKLSATIGPETLHKGIDNYMKGDRDFATVASDVGGRDLSWFFQQWKGGYPSDLDYRLENVRRNEKKDKGYLTRFTVEKSTSSQFVDPVEIRVRQEGEEARNLLWDGQGRSKTFAVQTRGKVTGIELDPRNRTVQTDVHNDLSPHSWEMVMDRGDVDIGTGGIGAGMRIRMHKVRDRKKWMFVLPFFSTAEYGVEAGMLFNFGGNVKGLVWNKKQEMSLSYTYTGLRSDFADPESHEIDGKGAATGVKFRYTFQNRMFEEDPMAFERFEFTTALYRKEFGGDFNFFRSKLTAAKVIALHPKHKLAGVVSLGYSEGFRSQDEVPAQKLFDLSSFPFIGFAASGRFLAKNAFATSLEWRHDLMSGLDMSMPMNNRIRRIQGVLAFDVGFLSDHFDQMFRLNQAVYGIRYGLRFHYDFLGIRPSDFTFDVGHRLGDGDRDGGSNFIIAFGILQSF
ncbi:MAG: hypothetical protein ACE5JX_10410 [Acidobacteriota bacterium]